MPQSWLPIVKVPMFAGENQGPVAPHEAGKNRAEPVYACRSGPVLAWPGAQNAKPLVAQCCLKTLKTRVLLASGDHSSNAGSRLLRSLPVIPLQTELA